MKQVKQLYFSAIFLVFIVFFSVVNFMQAKDDLADAGKDIETIQEKGIGTYVKQIEHVAETEVFGKLYFIEIYGLMQRLMDKQEMNQFEIVSDENGYLNYAEFYEEQDTQVTEYAKRIRRMQETVGENGAKVFFVNPIQKNVRGITETADGFPIADYNPIQDELLTELADNGIPCLDTRETLRHTGLSYQDMFFKTDHHWTGQAAFFVFTDLVAFMNKEYDAGLDPNYFYRNINHYQLENYKNCMLGSMGRDAGILYAGLEDIMLIYPKFPTSVTYTRIMDSGETTIETGSIRDTLISQEEIDSTDIYNTSKYGMYLEELTSAEVIVNHNNPNGPKVLCIRDSYFSPCMEFLTPLCSEIHAIWALGDAPGYEIEDYVKENTFDYIIVELYPGNIEESAFPFFEEPMKEP